jgi:hypothetical protein
MLLDAEEVASVLPTFLTILYQIETTRLDS